MGVESRGEGRRVPGGKRAVLRDLPGVSRIHFHRPEVGVVFALTIGFPSVVWGQWHGEMPTVGVAVWFSRGIGYAPRVAYVYTRAGV